MMTRIDADRTALAIINASYTAGINEIHKKPLEYQINQRIKFIKGDIKLLEHRIESGFLSPGAVKMAQKTISFKREELLRCETELVQLEIKRDRAR